MNSTEIYNYSGSLVDLNFTYSYSKYSCIKEFYFIHLTLCYFVLLSGIACFITRLYPPIKWLHVWFGRIYIISMLLTTASSLLIHNTGLPGSTLIAFAFTLCGMSLGWIIIKFYQSQIRKIATNLVEESIKQMKIIDNKTFNLEQLYNDKLIQYLNHRNWKQRYFSLKTVHGVLMTLSIFGIIGRIFASDQSGNFTCYTYPVYKPVNADMGGSAGMDLQDKPLQIVPEDDPDYDKLPWAGVETLFALRGVLIPIGVGAIIGLVWACVAAKQLKKMDSYTALKKEDANVEKVDIKDIGSNGRYGSTELQETNIDGDH